MMVCGRVALGTIVKLLVIGSKPAIRLSLKFRSLLKSNQKSWAFGLEAAKQTSKVPEPRAWEVLFVPNLSSGVSVGSPHSRMPSLKIPSLYGWNIFNSSSCVHWTAYAGESALAFRLRRGLSRLSLRATSASQKESCTMSCDCLLSPHLISYRCRLKNSFWTPYSLHRTSVLNWLTNVL